MNKYGLLLIGTTLINPFEIESADFTPAQNGTETTPPAPARLVITQTGTHREFQGDYAEALWTALNAEQEEPIANLVDQIKEAIDELAPMVAAMNAEKPDQPEPAAAPIAEQPAGDIPVN